MTTGFPWKEDEGHFGNGASGISCWCMRQTLIVNLVDAFSFSFDQENDSDNLSQNTSAEDGSIFSI